MKIESDNGDESALGPMVHMLIIAMKSLLWGSLCLDQQTSESKFWTLSLITKRCPDAISNLSRVRDFQNAWTTRYYLVPFCQSQDEDKPREREEPMWRPKANNCLGVTISQVALVPDKKVRYYREVISLIMLFAKVLQTLTLDPG